MRTVGDPAHGPQQAVAPVRQDGHDALAYATPQSGPPPSRHPTFSRPQPNPPSVPIPQHATPPPARRQPKLLDRLCETLRSRYYSRRAEQCYCHWVKRFIFFHNVRHPAEMAEPEINAFLTHLAVMEAARKAGSVKRVGCHTFRLPRTCSNAVTTSEPSRNSWATQISR